ncbi:hypothetical protein D3C87_1857480 [compost metagenome]
MRAPGVGPAGQRIALAPARAVGGPGVQCRAVDSGRQPIEPARVGSADVDRPGKLQSTNSRATFYFIAYGQNPYATHSQQVGR